MTSIDIHSKIIALSALKTFFDSSEDNIDLYGRVVLSIIEQNKSYSIEQINITVQSKFDINIPPALIKTLVKRLKREKKIEFINKKISILNNGVKIQEKIREQINNVEREENFLLSTLQNYLGENYSTEEVKNFLYEFIKNNSYVAAITLNQENAEKLPVNRDIDKKIKEFFVEAEKNKPAIFDKLKTLLLGTIISANLFSEKNKKSDVSFSKVTVFLDTNIILSILGFDSEPIVTAVKETIDLIKNAEGKLKIFPHTKSETIGLLRGFLTQGRFYPSGISVAHVYSYMKHKGYDSNAVRMLIEDFDTKMQNLGITIASKEIDDIQISSDDMSPHISNLIKLKGENYNLNSLECDSKSLIYIQELRSKKVKHCYIIENCLFFLLTADLKLAKLSMDLRNEQQVPEIFSYEQLTAILWLKNNDVASNSVARDFLHRSVTAKIISGDLWILFIIKLNQFKEDFTLADQDIEQLISMESTQRILYDKGEAGIKEILNEQHLQEIKKQNKDKDNLIENQKKEIQEGLEREEELKNMRQKSSKKRATKYVEKLCIIISCGLIIISVLIVISTFIFFSELIFIPSAFISLMLFCIAWQFNSDKDVIPERLKRWMPPCLNIQMWKKKKIDKLCEQYKKNFLP